MRIDIYLHSGGDDAVMDRLIRMGHQLSEMEKKIMGKLDDIKAALAAIGSDIEEIDDDVQEVLDKLTSTPPDPDGLTAAETADLLALVTDLKSKTRATADKVPEPA